MFQRQPPPEVTIAQLAEASGYDSFGGWITAVKKKYSLTQGGIARVARRYFEAAKVKPPISQAAIGRLERNDLDRYPRFCELEPLYRALVEHGGLGLPLSVEERELYLYFARKRIEERQRKERLTEDQWQTLADRLLLLTPNPKSRFHLVRSTEQRSHERDASLPRDGQEEDPNSRRKRAIQSAKDTDLRLFLEREEWVEHMLTYPEMTLQMKVVIVQAGKGAGKSYATAFLLQHLDMHENYFLVPYLFEAGESKTPDDYLEEFLATILADLTLAKISDEGKSVSLERRIEQFFAELHKRAEKQQKVIFVLDNAHLIFPSVGAWAPSWSLFFERFARDTHSATMYVMTQTWPGWGHPQAFVSRTDLPALSVSACVSIWHHFGFRDVPKDVLEKISARCGCNPRLIELLVSWCQKSTFGVRWGRAATVVSGSSQSPNTQKLETLLSQDSIFELRVDAKTRTVLQSAVGSELSHQAKAMLECLACSPLGLPVPLLAEEFVGALDALGDLESASALDLSMASSNRAALVPFVREAMLLSLAADSRRDAVESRVTDLYAYWLQEGKDFKDDTEKAGLIAEMVVRYLRAGQLLKAAELLIQFGWLCALFGQVPRIQRVYEEAVNADKGKGEDVAHEVGRLLLQHRIRVSSGQKIERDWRDQIYQDIHQKIIAGEVVLQPHSELEVLHNMFLFHSRREQLVEASSLFDQTLERLQQSEQMTPEVSALFLGNKTRLFAHWWDQIESRQNQGEIQHLRQQCLAAFKESITQWQLCLKNALPLQEQYYHFKLGRVLNDYAYRLRLVGDLDRAEEAITESLRLKKASNTLPHSIAISLGEHAQILALKGDIRKALSLKEEAILILEDLSNKGDTSHDSERGVFLFEHAKILKMQARLEEAKAGLVQAIPLIGNKPARQHFRLEADKEREEISFILDTGQHYQLDKRWFSRYLELASYDEVNWIAYAGPFSDDMQTEWKRLYPQREQEEVSAHLDALILQSRRDEFARSQEEQRAPKLWYPHILLEEVQDRIKKFGQLQQDIEREEGNAIVCSLYTDIVSEQILRLRQYEATVLENQDVAWQCNLSLYGKPSTQEFYIALQALCKMVIEAQSHEQAGPVAEAVLRQLKTWGLEPHDIVAMKFFSSGQEPVPSFKQKLIDGEREFSPLVIQRFFQDVLDLEYHADNWRVEIEPTRTGAGVDVNARKLFLPPTPFSLEKIRELLAEEIEVHALRSFSGLQSPLALLGSGLARYSATEEGLAKHAVQQVCQHTLREERGKTWIWTLTTGLASGILTPPVPFYELAIFLEKRFLIEKLLESRSISWEKAVATAKQVAWARAARTFLLIPHLEEAGCCSLKGVTYLRGYIDVKQKLKQVEEQRLFVGKIGTEHLNAMSELNILAPFCQHHHLALAPDLFDRVVQYEK